MIAREKRTNKKREESLDVSPHAQDQSNKEPLKEANSWSSELSTPSNIRLLHSLYKQHIKHNETKFQMFEGCF